MEEKESDPLSDPQEPDEELISLAFDCSEMVTILTRGYQQECLGKHESAMNTLESVEDRIDNWLEKLSELDTKVVDKKKISRNLLSAREAVRLD